MVEKISKEKIIDLDSAQEVEEKSLLNPLSDRLNNFKINFAILSNRTPFDSESKLNDWSVVAVKFFDSDGINSESTGGENQRVLKLKFNDAVGITKFLSGVKSSAEKSGLQHYESKDTHFVNSPGGRNLFFYRKNSNEIIIPLNNHKWGELLDYLTVFFEKLK